MDKPAAALREDDDVREFYLGLRDEGGRARSRRQALPEAQAMGGLTHALGDAAGLPARRCPRADRCCGCATCTCGFFGVQALQGVSLRGRTATSCSRSSGPTARARPRCSTACPASTAPSRARSSFLGADIRRDTAREIAAAGVARMFQIDRAVRQPHGARQPDAGTPPARALRHVGGAGLGSGGRGARSWRTARVVEQIVEFLEIERYRKLAGGLTAVRDQEAGGARPRAGDGAEAAAARRAGGRA